MKHDFTVVFAHYDQLASGLINTLLLTGATLILASITGCVIAGLMLSRNRFVRTGISLLVDTLRCIPFLLLAYLVYYALPAINIQLDSWSSGLVALVLYHTAYIGEILRGAWLNLSRDQIETGRAYGFRGFILFRKIIFPQLFYASAPIVGNQAIYIVKDTAFLMIIAVPELTFAASSIQSTYFVPFASFVVAMLLYWFITLITEAVVRRIESAGEIRRAA